MATGEVCVSNGTKKKIPAMVPIAEGNRCLYFSSQGYFVKSSNAKEQWGYTNSDLKLARAAMERWETIVASPENFMDEEGRCNICGYEFDGFYISTRERAESQPWFLVREEYLASQIDEHAQGHPEQLAFMELVR